MDAIDLLFSLIRSEFTKAEISTEEKKYLSADMYQKLYSLSSKHDLAHIVGDALYKNGLLSDDEVSAKFKNSLALAVYRVENSKSELNHICDIFSSEKIPFVLLKGAVIRNYYPIPWMRTSCDMDILVHEEDLERAASVLVSKYNFKTDGKKNYHDISLYSKNGIHLELHFNIKEDIENIDKVLSKVWQHTTPSKENKYKYEMTNEFLLFHILAHMSYHFVSGGCGIRSIIDLWILENNMSFERKTLDDLLDEANLSQFYTSIESLIDVWFKGKPHTEITKQTEDYILRGGVYGNLENNVLVNQQKQGGKFLYAVQKIFLPYNKLKRTFPIIVKHRWLTPLAWVMRWFKIIFDGRTKQSVKKLSYNNKITKTEADNMQQFLKDIGL